MLTELYVFEHVSGLFLKKLKSMTNQQVKTIKENKVRDCLGGLRDTEKSNIKTNWFRVKKLKTTGKR